MECLFDARGRSVFAVHVVRPFALSSPFEGLGFTLVLDVRDPAVTPDEQVALSDRIVAIGCRNAAILGFKCSSWDDSIDLANLEQFGFADIPDDRFVLTSWHRDESAEDVVEFVSRCSHAGGGEPTRFLVVCLGGSAVEYEDLRSRAAARFTSAFA